MVTPDLPGFFHRLRLTWRRAPGKGQTAFYMRARGRPGALRDGTFTQASPSRTILSSTMQVQASRAWNFPDTSSATTTLTSTVSPILIGARKFNVCEIYIAPGPDRRYRRGQRGGSR